MVSISQLLIPEISGGILKKQYQYRSYIHIELKSCETDSVLDEQV